MEQNETQRSITIAELWEIFINHIWQIIIVGLLMFAIILGYSVFSYKPEYTSSATLYILRQNEDSAGSTSVSNSDFSLALSTLNDCTYLLTSRNVLEQVISSLGMDISYKALKSMVRVSNPDSSRVLEVSITAPTPSDAKIIVDKLCEIGSHNITETLGINQINQIDSGSFSENPSNSQFTPYSIVGGLVGAFAVFAIYLLIYIFDDKISSPDDVEKYIGLSVLGLIPNASDTSAQRYGKGSYASPSGAYGGNNK